MEAKAGAALEVERVTLASILYLILKIKRSLKLFNNN
jgi:hypothetical protein